MPRLVSLLAFLVSIIMKLIARGDAMVHKRDLQCCHTTLENGPGKRLKKTNEKFIDESDCKTHL